jgi:hypothetical protein
MPFSGRTRASPQTRMARIRITFWSIGDSASALVPVEAHLVSEVAEGLRRAEMWRGGLGLHSGGLLYRSPVPRYQTVLRFHFPLIEPDMPYERWLPGNPNAKSESRSRTTSRRWPQPFRKRNCSDGRLLVAPK